MFAFFVVFFRRKFCGLDFFLDRFEFVRRSVKKICRGERGLFREQKFFHDDDGRDRHKNYREDPEKSAVTFAIIYFRRDDLFLFRRRSLRGKICRLRLAGVKLSEFAQNVPASVVIRLRVRNERRVGRNDRDFLIGGRGFFFNGFFFGAFDGSFRQSSGTVGDGFLGLRFGRLIVDFFRRIFFKGRLVDSRRSRRCRTDCGRGSRRRLRRSERHNFLKHVCAKFCAVLGGKICGRDVENGFAAVVAFFVEAIRRAGISDQNARGEFGI